MLENLIGNNEPVIGISLPYKGAEMNTRTRPNAVGLKTGGHGGAALVRKCCYHDYKMLPAASPLPSPVLARLF